MPVTATTRRDGIRDRRVRGHGDVVAVIAAGGMLGAAARFALADAVDVEPGRFPWATFWTNASGSFLLGFVLVLLLERFPPSRYLRLFLGGGVLGSFTTMSTFLVDTALLAKDGHVLTAVAYAGGTVVVGLLLASIGVAAARRSPRRRVGGEQ